MPRSNRPSKRQVTNNPRVMRTVANENRMWFETPVEIQAGLEWGKEKRRLLKWVRRQMFKKLSIRERRCIELYYFQNLTFRQVSEVNGITVSSVHRAVRRALRKFRHAAKRKNAPRLEPR